MKLKSGIYSIRNIIDNKMYIGYASDISKRLYCHKSLLRLTIHPNIHLQRAVDKYGIENFEFEIIEKWEKKYLPTMEHFWATILNTHNENYGYNVLPTNPNNIVKFSLESISKMKSSGKKRKFSESQISQIRNLGKSWKGKKTGIACVQKALDKWYTPIYQVNKNTDEIIQLFDTITKAAFFLKDINKTKSINSAKSCICEVCKNKQKTAYGFKWKYTNEKI